MTVLVETTDEHRHALRREVALLMLGVASLIAALVAVLLVAWLILSSPKATGFDADGVRCYARASQMACIKTAEPPR